MARSRNVYKLTSLLVLGVSAVFAAARIVVLVYNIELSGDNSGFGYYIAKTPTTVFFVIAVAVFSVGIILMSLLQTNKNTVIPNTCCEEQTQSFAPPPIVFTSALSGFMLLSTGMYFILLFCIKKAFTAVDCIHGVLMVLSSLSFLCASLVKGAKTAELGRTLRIFPVILIIFRLITDFIKQNNYPTTSSASFHILSLVFLMMFLVYDAKNAINKVNYRLFYAASLLSAFFMYICAVPNIALSGFWLLEMDEHILVSATDIVLASYAITRAYTAYDRSAVASSGQ